MQIGGESFAMFSSLSITECCPFLWVIFHSLLWTSNNPRSRGHVDCFVSCADGSPHSSEACFLCATQSSWRTSPVKPRPSGFTLRARPGKKCLKFAPLSEVLPFWCAPRQFAGRIVPMQCENVAIPQSPPQAATNTGSRLQSEINIQ